MARDSSSGKTKTGAGRRDRTDGRKKLARPVDARSFRGGRAGGLKEQPPDAGISAADRKGTVRSAGQRAPEGGPGRDGFSQRRVTEARRERCGAGKVPGAGRSTNGVDATGSPGGGARAEAKDGDKGNGEGRTVERPRGRLASGVSRLSPRAVILALLALLFIGCALGPTLRNIQANSRLNGKENELKKQRSYTESLEGEVDEAGSMNYVEEEARRQRLVAPGEILYLVTTDEHGSEIEYRLKSLQSMEEAWEQVRRMLNCGYEADGIQNR